MEIWYLIRCLKNNFKDGDNFRKYCNFVTNCKKKKVSYEELEGIVDKFLYCKGTKNIMSMVSNGNYISITDDIYK